MPVMNNWKLKFKKQYDLCSLMVWLCVQVCVCVCVLFICWLVYYLLSVFMLFAWGSLSFLNTFRFLFFVCVILIMENSFKYLLCSFPSGVLSLYFGTCASVPHFYCPIIKFRYSFLSYGQSVNKSIKEILLWYSIFFKKFFIV